MEPTTEPAARPPYVRALRDELVGAHHRLARRRRQRQGLATAIVVLVLGGLAAVLVGSIGAREAAADVLTVEPLPDGTTQVTIIDTGASLADIRASLEANHIPNTVDGASTGPSLVGRFVTVGVLSNDRVAIAADHRSLTVPAGYKGRLLVTIGVAAKPGEAYRQPTIAFDDGEPLAGFPDPTNATAVVAAARAAGLAVRVLDAAGTPAGTIPAGAHAQYAVMTDARSLTLRLAP